MALVAAAPALADPKVDGIFDLARVQTNGQLTVGPDGNIWVALDQAVGKVTPTGETRVLKVSQPGGAPPETIVKITPGDSPTATGVAGESRLIA
jgi:hypothetical protein